MPLHPSPVLSGTAGQARSPARSGNRPADTAVLTLDDPVCAVCRHTVASHDAIGLRFCAATLNGAIPRGCICRPR